MQCPRCATEVKTGAKFCPKCGAGLPSWTGRLINGDVLIERYKVVRPLARGGMGAVYLAQDMRLGDAPVALKEMVAYHRQGDTAAWQQAISEFRREAALLARLSHPNLPKVIDQFEHNENEFLVMEYIEGRTLRAEMEQHNGIVPTATALKWFHELAGVLGYLHRQNPPIIYRDLKPANVMLRNDGRITLIDFGIARLYKAGQTGDTAVYGTPGYAPPEQYGFGQTDARSDVYSLAMLMHEILTREDPINRGTSRPMDLAAARPDLPAHMAAAIHRAMANDADSRFQSMNEFVAAMDDKPETVILAPSNTAHQAAMQAPSLASPPQRRGRSLMLWGSLIGFAMTLFGFLAWYLLQKDDPVVNTPTSVPATSAITQASPVVETPAITPVPTPQIAPAPPSMKTVIGQTYWLGSANGSPDEQPAGQGFVKTFYLDRTEITNAQYQACVTAGDCTPPADRASLTRPDYYDNPEFAEFPVINVTWEQAKTYCAAQGQRLPTEAEWERAARGTDQRNYPWGDAWDVSKLNVWGGGKGGDTVQVGSFADGASPDGLLDMAGNVAEWTSSLDFSYPYNSGDGREVPTAYGARIIRGSFNGDDPFNARVSKRERRQPTEYANNVGFRCATSEGYKPVGMDLIPAGTWTMGLTQAELDQVKAKYGWEGLINEQPATVITTSAFFLDRTEVTNGAYAEFVAATQHKIPQNPYDPVGLSVWLPDGTFPISITDHPVVNVTWDDAVAYCAWRGKRLPTEAEWERAARGDDGRIWAWGNDWRDDAANTKESNRGITVPVGTLDGAGPYGTQDLGGNVWEWTSSVALPYPYNPTDGRESPNERRGRTMRGGSWLDDKLAAHTTGRNSFQPDGTNVNIGFRCAQSVEK